MKNIQITIVCLLILCGYISQAQTQTENYIYVIEPLVEVSNVTSNTSAKKSIQYFDGLGRPKQIVQVKASPLQKDVVTHIEYDEFGRQAKDYLPWPSNQANGKLINPSTLKNNTISYYKQGFPCPDGNLCNENPYSEKELENSPLNRVMKQTAPGEDWKLGSGHEIKFQYSGNLTGDSVKIFKVNLSSDYTPTLTQAPGHYGANLLYKTTTIDENGNALYEFKNKNGQVILKRTFVDASTKAGTDPVGLTKQADTYYVYDIYGNLSYVIPPLAAVKTTISQTILNDLCYQYRYDSRNRLVVKKLPGKGEEWLVYDKQDRLVATKDAKQVAEGNNEWNFIKYDKFGRVAYTGLTWDTGNRVQVQNHIIGNYGSNNTEYDETGFMHDNIKVYYKHDMGYPRASVHILTVNYYDKYPPSLTSDNIPNPTIQGVPIRDGVTEGQSLKGMLTSTINRAMGTWNFEKVYTFYDLKSRPVYTHKINHLGGYTKVSNFLDFRGKPTSTITYHKYNTSGTEIKIKDNYTYDAQERLKNHTQQINNGITERIANNSYNEIGSLTRKLVGNKQNVPALQSIDYDYNIRGWLTGINNIGEDLQLEEVSGQPFSDIFAFKIQYNHLIYGGEVAATPLYNGNISQTFWKSASDNKIRGYSYEYDQMNRLRFAHFNRITGTTQTGYYPGAFDESLAYDLNGNILHLIRHTEDANGRESAMDDLKYTYKNGNNNSNQLLKVVDDTNSTAGFSNGTSGTSNDYTYDANGNMISDKNKNITSIEYNHLNLPTKIKWNNSETRKIEYLYNASGVKLQKKVTNGTRITTTEYIDGFQYVNGVLQFFPTAEGYVKNTVVNGQNTYDYIYNYTDHLGNIRMSYTKDPQTGDLKILEENHYYPFGLKHKTYANIGLKMIEAINNETEKALVNIGLVENDVTATLYKYKYNGKEYQDELGLNMYDMDMRQYDPAIARWVVMDPIEHHSMSPYNSFDNNPVFWADPSGADSENNLWDETDKSRTREKIIQEKSAENSNRITTTYVNENTGESVWINDGVDQTVLVSDRLFAKAKVFKAYFGDWYIMDNHALASKYADFYYEARYGKAYMANIDYWLDSGPKYSPSVIGGSRSIEFISNGGFNILKAFKAAISAKKIGGLSEVGRAIQKHPNVLGLIGLTSKDVSTNAQRTEAGAKVLKYMIRNGTTTTKNTKNYGQVVDVKLSNGLGARFSAENNTFIGFLGRGL